MSEKPVHAIPAYYALFFARLTETARPLGWALALHGSLANDLDIVAIPWTEEAAEPEQLLARLVDVHGLMGWDETYGTEKTAKPHGRQAIILYMGGEFYIDFSIMPRIPKPNL